MVGSKLNNETPTGFQSPHEGYSGHPANRFLPGQTQGGNPGIDVMMSQSPDVVLLHLGSNDMRLAQSISGTANEIDQIVTRIWANNSAAEVFVANVIPWYGTSSTNSNVQSDIQQLGTAIETWVTNKADSRLHLVDVRSQYSPNMMISDLIHPNAVGEAHIADAFLDALDIAFPNTDFSCGAPTVDLIAPETFIAVPADGSSVNETTTFSGTATDTGGSGFDKVWIAIRDENSSQWYNFTNGTFGSISQGGVDVGITDANLSNTTTTSTDWAITATLPTGDYTFFALSFDNAGNDAFHGRGLSVWPINHAFSIANTDIEAPTAAVTSPADNSTISPNGSADITGTAFDADSGISRVRVRVQQLGITPRLYWNGNAWTESSAYPDATVNENGTAWTLPGVDLTNPGNYRIHIYAYDNAGNIATSADNPRTGFSTE